MSYVIVIFDMFAIDQQFVSIDANVNLIVMQKRGVRLEEKLRILTYFILTESIDVNIDPKFLLATHGIINPLNCGVLMTDAFLHTLFIAGVGKATDRVLNRHGDSMTDRRIVGVVAAASFFVHGSRL